MGAGKVANIWQRSRTMAIEGYFILRFEHAAFLGRNLFSVTACFSKLKGDYFDNRQEGANILCASPFKKFAE
jgi:hypothetical protein